MTAPTTSAVYDFHRRQLQHLWWHKPGDRWMLKTGAHMWGLGAAAGDLSRRADRVHPPRPGEIADVVREPDRAGALAGE